MFAHHFVPLKSVTDYLNYLINAPIMFLFWLLSESNIEHPTFLGRIEVMFVSRK